MSPFSLLLALFVLALLFDFLNGFHDGANVVATIIASRAMSARGALALTAVANLAGPFLLGVAVTQTIGTEVVRPQAITIAVLLAALASACLWDFITWYCGVPVSSSHALLGGLLGATVIEAGPEAIQSAGLWKIATALLVAPLLGFSSCWPRAGCCARPAPRRTCSCRARKLSPPPRWPSATAPTTRKKPWV
jgi:PiT family inorganic phosphate transporter